MTSPEQPSGRDSRKEYSSAKRKATGIPLDSKITRESYERLDNALFGAKSQRKRASRKAESEARHKEYLEGLERMQFERALEKIDAGVATDIDVSYAFSRAGKFLEPLTEEELGAGIQNIGTGNYSNADILRVSNHFLLIGNDAIGIEISRMVYSYENGKPKSNFSPIPPGAVDAIDLQTQRDAQ